MEALEQVKAWPAATRSYINELQLEMKRVTWPSKKQVQATTAVVILTVFAFAAYFAVVDLVLTRSVTKVYDIFTK
jgi:preprotein translocase subunit SecE